MKRTNYDTRLSEHADETRARFRRCLAADVSWWRENASVISDRYMRQMALNIALELERISDRYLTEPARAHGETP